MFDRRGATPKRRRIQTAVGFASVLFVPLAVLSAKPKTPAVGFEIAPAPAWVKPIVVEAGSPGLNGKGGVTYPLIDRQENIDASASYYHEVRQSLPTMGRKITPP